MATNGNVSVTLISRPFNLAFPEQCKPKAYQPRGASKPKGEPEYSFEGISDLDQLTGWKILDKEKVEVLASSKQMKRRYGSGAVVVKFRWHDGQVMHVVSHFYR